MKFIKNHIVFISLLVIYLIVNLFFLIMHPGTLFNQPERFGEAISTYGSRDASLYAKMAWQLITDGVYGYNIEGSNAYVTYGHPLYLTALFKIADILNTNHIMVFRMSNMLLNLGIVILIYAISMRLFKHKWVAILASIFYMTHIGPLHYFRTALTEIPAIFLFLLSIWLFLFALAKDKYRYHILFGIVASLLLMFRATPAPMLLFAWFIVFGHKGFKEAVKIGFLWVIGPIVVMVPWVIRNLIMFGEPYLFSSHSGGPLLGGANPFYLIPQAELVQQSIAAGLNDSEYGKQRIMEGFETDFPLWFSWFTIGKTLWLFFDNLGNPDGLGPYSDVFTDFWLGFFKYQNMFVVTIAFLSAILLRKHKPLVYISTLLLIYIFFSNIFLTIPRYGLLVFPIVAIVAAYGLVTFGTFVKNKVKSNRV